MNHDDVQDSLLGDAGHLEMVGPAKKDPVTRELTIVEVVLMLEQIARSFGLTDPLRARHYSEATNIVREMT